MGVYQTPLTANKSAQGVAMEISTDAGSNWLDCGVLGDGYEWVNDYSANEVEHGNAENPDSVAKNQKITVTPSELRTWNSTVMAAVASGLFTIETIAGTPVAGATQTATSGNWSFDTGILLDGQNSSGLVPTINSVTGSVDGAGAADDWTTVKAQGGWMLVPLDGTNFTTETQDLVIDYDYTPASGSYIYSGSSSNVLTPYQVKFTHYTDVARTAFDYQHIIYRVFIPAGAMTLTKKGDLSGNDYDTWTISLVGYTDSARDSGKQLFRLYQDV